MSVIVSSETEFSQVIAGSALTVVEFTGPDCIICKKLEPMLQAAVARSAIDISVVRIDASFLVDVAERYSIRSVPTLIAFRDSSVVSRRVGFATAAELCSWFDGAAHQPGQLQ